jgi:maltose O-acetyltransferase
VGEDVIIYAPTKTLIDTSYPWMISIGNHVRITQGVVILTHDYSWSVLKIARGGRILGASGKVCIGNNVFIGMGATIVRGVTIEDNVIIGAGSVVTKDCKANGIYAGNPAERIGDIDQFCAKRAEAQLEEAKELALAYYDRYQKKPSADVFHEYFMLFETSDSIWEKTWCVEKMQQGCNFEESLAYLKANLPMFPSYDDFLNYCFRGE